MDLQQEETGTLMANTIHTMSMRLRQIVMRDGGESKVGPELLSGVKGSWVVAGTCLFRKLPLAVEAASERFPLLPGATSDELLFGRRSHVGVVPFPDQRPALVPSVPFSQLPLSEATVVRFCSARPPGMLVVFAAASVGSVEDGEDVVFSGGI